jgi:nitroreductase
MQPWHFCAVFDPAVKRRIREKAEETERAFYERRASQEWLQALAPLGTSASKPFLEQAPCLIAVMAQRHGVDAQGNRVQHYYVTHSVGIATGFLIAALHHAGLAVLPYTPSPMAFLREILDRPENERPFLLLVVGYPATGVTVPQIDKKPLDEIATFV